MDARRKRRARRLMGFVNFKKYYCKYFTFVENNCIIKKIKLIKLRRAENENDALNTCYGVKGTLQGVLTPNQIEPYVSRQRPGCINWLEVNNEHGHSTAFCGYSSDSLASQYGIRISDSNEGDYIWLYKNGKPSQKLGFQYTYGSLTYNWKSTITT